MVWIGILISLLIGVLNSKLMKVFLEENRLNEKAVIAFHMMSVLVALKFYDGILFLLIFAIWATLIHIMVVDFYTHSIYMFPLYLLGALVVLFIFITPHSIGDAFWGGLTGLALYFLIYGLAKWYYKREAFGMGDVYLMGIAGSLFNWKYALMTSVFAFYIALAGLGLIFIKKRKLSLDEPIAFGPYICLSVMLIMVFGEEIFLAIFH